MRAGKRVLRTVITLFSASVVQILGVRGIKLEIARSGAALSVSIRWTKLSARRRDVQNQRLIVIIKTKTQEIIGNQILNYYAANTIGNGTLRRRRGVQIAAVRRLLERGVRDVAWPVPLILSALVARARGRKTDEERAQRAASRSRRYE